jgi:hypothetical protein
VAANSVRRRVVFPVLQPSASFVRLHGGRSWVGLGSGGRYARQRDEENGNGFYPISIWDSPFLRASLAAP